MLSIQTTHSQFRRAYPSFRDAQMRDSGKCYSYPPVFKFGYPRFKGGKYA